MRHSRALLVLSATALGTAVMLPVAAQAAVVRPATVACTESALVAAVNAANSAGGGTVTLTPGCTYTLTASHGSDGVNGPDGLPIITTPVSFSGNANVITRAPGAAPFRVVQVAPTGALTLNAVTLSGGDATAADNNGGGVLNFGGFTATGSALSGNTAAGTGGALYNSGISSAATFTSSTVKSNHAARGAGLADNLGTLTTTSTVINANAASTSPGGVYFLAGTITTTSTTITANTPTNCVGSPSPVPGCVG